MELLGAYGPGNPHYVSALTLDDYFSERVTGAQAIKIIRDAWIATPKAFIIDKRRNELRYNAAQVWEASNILKELPEDLMPHKSREWVIMRLDRASAFFSMDFRKGFLDTFRGR